jgi:hypothetical protein
MAGIWDLIMEAIAEAHDGSVQMINASIAGREVGDQNTCLRRY